MRITDDQARERDHLARSLFPEPTWLRFGGLYSVNVDAAVNLPGNEVAFFVRVKPLVQVVREEESKP